MSFLDFGITNWLLVFLRISALLSVFPVFSAPNYPVQLRLALGALISFMIAPSLPVFQVEQLSLLQLTGFMAMEVGVGLLLGFVSRLCFFMVQFAGYIISIQMGLSMAPQINPLSQDSQQAPGVILFYLAATMFLALDLHHWLLLAMQRTYDVVPIGAAGLSDALFHDLNVRVAGIFNVGVQMAAPVMAISVIVTLVFAVLGRTVPQMNVFSESFSFRVLAGLMMFGATIHLMAQHLSNYLRRLPDDVFRIAQLLGGA